MSMLTIVLSIALLLLFIYVIVLIISLRLLMSFIEWKYIKLMYDNKEFAEKKFDEDFKTFKEVTNGRDLIKRKF